MTEIRLAEDQMQRLIVALFAATAGEAQFNLPKGVVWGHGLEMLEAEPKPEPAPTPCNLSDIVKSVITKENHCDDCCCAKAWEALGVTKYSGKDIPAHIEELKTQISCLKSNLDAANDRAHMAEGRAYSLMCDYNRCKKEAELEVERLKAQVPKERACVTLGPYGAYYELFMAPIIFGDRESATKWAEERCLEVVE